MAVRQLNSADYDFAMMLETLNKAYKGKPSITISNYDNDSAPVVKVGSVWEDNGALLILETSDMTPTGYAGIANSTTFYLYYDESGEVFIYDSAVPTWNDALQGYYSGNDRAFFKMFKNSGGTLYQSKKLLLAKQNYNMPNALTVENDLTVNGRNIDMSGASDADANIEFASDADLVWDESEDEFVFNKKLQLNADLRVASDIISDTSLRSLGLAEYAYRINHATHRLHGSKTQNEIYDALNSVQSTTSVGLQICGGVYTSSLITLSHAIKISATQYTLYGINTAGTVASFTANNGSSSSIVISMTY